MSEGYFYECPSCSTTYDFDPNHQQTFSELPERHCQHCSKQGCLECVRDDGCRNCRDDIDAGIDGFSVNEGEDSSLDLCQSGCLACLNGWSHGDDRD